MEPFSIPCTTCKSKLKVIKPEAIGQIFACPRCGSMVLIERPADSTGSNASPDSGHKHRPPPTPSASPNLLGNSFDHVNELFAGGTQPSSTDTDVSGANGKTARSTAQPAPPASAPSRGRPGSEPRSSTEGPPRSHQPTKAGQRGTADAQQKLPTRDAQKASRDERKSTSPPIAAAPLATVAKPPSEPPFKPPSKSPTEPPSDSLSKSPTEPNTEPVSAAVATPAKALLWQSRLMIGVGAVTGAVLGVSVVGFVAFNRTQRPTTPPPAIERTASHAEAHSDIDRELPREGDQRNASVDHQPAPTERRDVPPADLNETTRGAPAQALPVADEARPAEPAGPVESRQSHHDSQAADAPAAVVTKAPGSGHDAGTPQDPLSDFDPASIEDDAPARNLFFELAGLTETSEATTDLPLTPPADQGVSEDSDADGYSLIDRDDMAAPQLAKQPALRPINVQARLQDPIVAVQIEKMPLRDFVRFFTNLSTIPVTIDPNALLYVQATLQTPVSVTQRGGTTADLMHQAIRPLHLAIQEHATGVTLTSAAFLREPYESSYDISDFAETVDARLADKWAHQLRLLTGAARWNAMGGRDQLAIQTGKLVITADEAGHFAVRQLLAQLRHARGLQQKSNTEMPARWVSGESRIRRSQSILGTQVTFHEVRPREFRQLVDQLAAQSHADMVVNWQALADAGWPPETPRTLSVQDALLADAISKLVAPMHLTYRSVDDRLLEITTRDAEQRQGTVEYYRLTSVVEPAGAERVMVQQLHEAVGVRHFYTGGGQGHAYFDVVSNAMFVRLPQSQQFLVERFFQAWTKQHTAVKAHGPSSPLPNRQ